MLKRSMALAAVPAMVLTALAIGFRPHDGTFSMAKADTAVGGVLANSKAPATLAAMKPDAAQLHTSASHSTAKNLLEVKLTDESGIRLRGDKLVLASPDGDAQGLAALQAQLDASGVKKVHKLFNGDEAQLDKQQADLSARSGKKVPNLNDWLSVELTGDNGVQAAADLKKLAVVAEAQVEAGVTTASVPDLTSYQMYRLPAPGGSDANYADNSGIAGARGSNVKVADVEYSWNHNHEDLSKLHLPAGASITPECDIEGDGGYHGTAVAGIVVGDDNGFGITGVAPDAAYMPASACGADGGGTVDDAITAINTAAQNETAGDVLLIELGASNLDNVLLPLEYYGAVHDAIANATAAGVIVVEAAGNGNANLDDPQWAGIFTTSRPNSGAIMVGAGNPSNVLDANAKDPCETSFPERSRAGFSDYGSRVDVQNWGLCVMTTGANYYEPYNIRDPNDPNNNVYNFNFNGTSSASALTAGIAASASSAYKAKNGSPATPQEIRDLLKQNSTPQDTTSPGIYTGNVGPLPDLKKVLDAITGGSDGSGSSVIAAPSGLGSKINPNGSVTVNWDAPTGTVQAASYLVFRDGTQITSTTKRYYIDKSVSADTHYVYTVKAQDANGDVSDASSALNVTTPIIADGFESGTFNDWADTNNVSILSTGGYGNTKGADASSLTGASASATAVFPTAKSNAYYRAMVEFTSSDTHNTNILTARTASGPVVVSLNRAPNGNLGFFNNVTTDSTTSTTALALNTWYDVQMHVSINGTSSTIEVWVNGTKVAALTTTQNFGTTPLGKIEIGDPHTGRDFDVVFDDVVVANDFFTAN